MPEKHGIQEFHDERIGARAPSEDLGKELERMSEHPKILAPEEDQKFEQHVSKIRKYQFPVDCMVAKPMTKTSEMTKLEKRKQLSRKSGTICGRREYGMTSTCESGGK